MKMSAEDKKEWLDALRSGQINQAQHLLHTFGKDGVEGFCCLGVLCKLQADKGKLHVGRQPSTYNITNVVSVATYDDQEGLLPRSMTQRFHCGDSGVFVPMMSLTPEEQIQYKSWFKPLGDKTGLWISDLNDEGMKFPRIAELLDQLVEVV